MSKSKTDHAVSLIKAGVSTIPIVGGAIASLVGDYIPTATQKSAEKTFQYLRIEIDKLKDRMDVENINKDEFSELFKSSYLVIIRTHEERKLQAAAAIISNIFLKSGDPEKLSFNELDLYVRCLDNLSIGAINVLGEMVRLARKSEPENVEKRHTRFTFQDINKAFSHVEPSFLMGQIAELNNFNLVHIQGSPQIRQIDYQNYVIELTPLGAKFVAHLLKS